MYMLKLGTLCDSVNTEQFKPLTVSNCEEFRSQSFTQIQVGVGMGMGK